MYINFSSSRRALVAFACSLFIVGIASSLASAQTPGTSSQPNATQSVTEKQITADENFELNIAERRITETNFERSTAVEFSDSNDTGLHVGVGVGVQASRIDVRLFGVRGRVRFRASLQPIFDRLRQTDTAPISNLLPVVPQTK